MRPSPANTRFVSERSPMIFFTGSGDFRINVGRARIWSERATCGFFKRSITFIWYLSFNCSSQINLRLLKAAAAFGVSPATYKRKTHFSLSALAGCSFRSTSRSTIPSGVFDISCLMFSVRSFRLLFYSFLYRLVL
jgi:hypothetical protein